jgi:hypothetical protein
MLKSRLVCAVGSIVRVAVILGIRVDSSILVHPLGRPQRALDLRDLGVVGVVLTWPVVGGLVVVVVALT